MEFINRGDAPKLSQFSPFWGNNFFIPGEKDMGFKLWADKGLCKIADLFNINVLMSFKDLKQGYDIQQRHFLKFLKLRSFVSETDKSLSLPNLTSVEEVAVKFHTKRGLISRFYGIIMDSSQASSETGQRLAGCEDLSNEITVEKWQKICYKAQTQSVNTHFKLIQFKWLMRTYIRPTLSNKLNPNIPDVCAKCGMTGTLFHCLQDSPYIQVFWREVLDTLSCAVLGPLLKKK